MKKLFTFILLVFLSFNLTALNAQAGQEAGTYGMVYIGFDVDSASEEIYYYPYSEPALIMLDGQGKGLVTFFSIEGKREEADSFVYVLSDSNYFMLYDSSGTGQSFAFGTFDKDFSQFSLTISDSGFFGMGYAVRISLEMAKTAMPLSGTYSGNQITYAVEDFGEYEKRQEEFSWSGESFSISIENDSVMSVISTDNFGEVDTSKVWYLTDNTGFLMIADTVAGDTVTVGFGFISSDGTRGVLNPFNTYGMTLIAKNSTSMDMAALPTGYSLTQYSAEEGGRIEIISTELRLDGAGNGSYQDVFNSSEPFTNESGVFEYGVAADGTLNIYVEDDTIAGIISPDGSFITFAVLDSGYVAIFQGIAKKGYESAVGDNEEHLAKNFILEQNYPNPFNPSTEIVYHLMLTQKVELSVYNILGQKIRVLEDGARAAGIHRVVWDGKDSRGEAVGSGIYFYRLKTKAGVETRKMTLIR